MEYQKTRDVFKKISEISGWFSREAALVLSLVDSIQKQNDLEGDLFEIGVHHGKSALFLHHFLRGKEKLRVCDIFGDQRMNISQSGVGDKAIFLNNCQRILGENSIQIFEKLSTDLTIDEIGRSYRLFHVDGGHCYEEALADLLLAKQALKEYGVIVLDDPFRHEWPGVTEAVIEFLKISPDFSVLLVGFNKLLLVRDSVKTTYTEAFDDASTRTANGLRFPWAYKTMMLAGKDMRCFYMPTYLQSPSLKVRIYLVLKRLGLR